MCERYEGRGSVTVVVQGGARTCDVTGSWNLVVQLARWEDHMETHGMELGWMSKKEVVVEEKARRKVG